MHDYFARQIEIAARNGVEKILIDPGPGLLLPQPAGQRVRVRHQMKVFLNTFRLRTLGFPICHALPHAFEYFGEEVRCAEPFFAVLAALGKTDLFRTHEVPRIKAVLDTLQAFWVSSGRHQEHAFLPGLRDPLVEHVSDRAGRATHARARGCGGRRRTGESTRRQRNWNRCASTGDLPRPGEPESAPPRVSGRCRPGRPR